MIAALPQNHDQDNHTLGRLTEKAESDRGRVGSPAGDAQEENPLVVNVNVARLVSDAHHTAPPANLSALLKNRISLIKAALSTGETQSLLQFHVACLSSEGT